MTTAAEKRHLSRVVELGCALCRHMGYENPSAEIHHPRTGVGAGRKAPHSDAIPMCPFHHRLGNESLHAMGRKAFERHHGVTEVELLAQTRALLGEE